MAEGQEVQGIALGLTLDTSGWSSGIQRAKAELAGLVAEAKGVQASIGVGSVGHAGTRVPQGDIGSVSPGFTATRGAVRQLRVDINQHLRTLSSQGEAVQIPVKLGRVNFTQMRNEITSGIGEVPVRVKVDTSSLRGQASLIAAIMSTATGTTIGKAEASIQHAAASHAQPIPKRAMGGPVGRPSYQTGGYVNWAQARHISMGGKGKLNISPAEIAIAERGIQNLQHLIKLSMRNDPQLSSANRHWYTEQPKIHNFAGRANQLGVSLDRFIDTLAILSSSAQWYANKADAFTAKGVRNPVPGPNIRAAEQVISHVTKGTPLTGANVTGEMIADVRRLFAGAQMNAANFGPKRSEFAGAYRNPNQAPIDRWQGRATTLGLRHQTSFAGLGDRELEIAMAKAVKGRDWTSADAPGPAHRRASVFALEHVAKMMGGEPRGVQAESWGEIKRLEGVGNSLFRLDKKTGLALPRRARGGRTGRSGHKLGIAPFLYGRTPLSDEGFARLRQNEGNYAYHGTFHLPDQPWAEYGGRGLRGIQRTGVEPRSSNWMASQKRERHWDWGRWQGTMAPKVSFWGANGYAPADIAGGYGGRVLRTPLDGRFSPNFDYDSPKDGPMRVTDQRIPASQLQYFGADTNWHGFRRGRRRAQGGPAYGRRGTHKIDPFDLMMAQQPMMQNMYAWENPRYMDSIKGSMESEGLQHPIRVRGMGGKPYVYDGNHRIQAALGMPGWGSLPVDIRDMDSGRFMSPKAFGWKKRRSRGGWASGIGAADPRWLSRQGGWAGDQHYNKPSWDDALDEGRDPMMYHVTSAANIPSIMEQGVLPGRGRNTTGTPNERLRRSYWSAYPDSGWGGKDPVALGTRLSNLTGKAFDPTGELAVRRPVDPSKLKFLASNRRLHPLIGKKMAGGPVFKPVEPNAFHSTISRAAQHEYTDHVGRTRKVGETVYIYPEDEYRAMRTFLNHEGTAGYAIKEGHDLVSVFNAGEHGSGVGKQIVRSAIQRGVTTLDAFDESGFLPRLYGKYGGFREMYRDQWNDEYAPEGWRGDKPDVVYMQRGKKRRSGGGPVGRNPNRLLRSLASVYSMLHGTGMLGKGSYLPLDDEFGQRTARAYERMPVGPDAHSRASFGAFADETNSQYEFLRKAGFRFSASRVDPYEPTGGQTKMQLAAEDVLQNRHLSVFSSSLDHPLMSKRDIFRFRGVHDLFGHLAEGYSIGPRGEYNAAMKHAAMYSPLAQHAMLSGTHGQNSYVNYSDVQIPELGDTVANLNRAQPGTIYAPAKASVLPRELIEEFRGRMPRFSRGGPFSRTGKPAELIHRFVDPNETPFGMGMWTPFRIGGLSSSIVDQMRTSETEHHLTLQPTQWPHQEIYGLGHGTEGQVSTERVGMPLWVDPHAMHRTTLGGMRSGRWGWENEPVYDGDLSEMQDFNAYSQVPMLMNRQGLIGIHNHPGEKHARNVWRPSNADLAQFSDSGERESWIATKDFTTILRSGVMGSVKMSPEDIYNVMEQHLGKRAMVKKQWTDLNAPQVSNDRSFWTEFLDNLGREHGFSWDLWHHPRPAKGAQGRLPGFAAGGGYDTGAVIAGELGRELFVPAEMSGLIPPDVMGRLPQRAEGGIVEIPPGPLVWQPPSDGWIIPNHLMNRVPKYHAGGGVPHRHPHANTSGAFDVDEQGRRVPGTTHNPPVIGIPPFAVPDRGRSPWAEALLGIAGPHGPAVPRPPLAPGSRGLPLPHIPSFLRGSPAGPGPAPSPAPAGPTPSPGPRAGGVVKGALRDAMLRQADESRSLLSGMEGLPTGGRSLDDIMQEVDARASSTAARGLTGRSSLGGLASAFLGGGMQRRRSQLLASAYEKEYRGFLPPGAKRGTDPVQLFSDRVDKARKAVETLTPGVEAAAKVFGEGSKEFEDQNKKLSHAREVFVHNTEALNTATTLHARREESLAQAGGGLIKNFASTTLAGVAFSVGQEVASRALDLTMKAVAPEIDRATGFVSTNQRVSGALAQQLPQAGTVSTLFAQQAGPAGLPASVTDYLQSILGPGVAAKAGANAAGQAGDLFRAAIGVQNGAPSGLLGGYGGLGGGQYFAEQLGGGKGFAESVAAQFADATGQHPTRTGPGGFIGDQIDNFSKAVDFLGSSADALLSGDPTRLRARYQDVGGILPAQITNVDPKSVGLVADTFNAAAQRAADRDNQKGFQIRTTGAAIGTGPNSANRAIELSRLAATSDQLDENTRSILKAGYVFTDATGKILTSQEEINKAYQQSATGFTLPDPKVFLKAQQQALTAGEEASAIRGGVERSVSIPGQLGQQLAANPFLSAGTGIAKGFKSTIADLGTTQRMQDELTKSAQDGITAQRKLVEENLGAGAGVEFGGLMSEVADFGKQIAGLQSVLANRQARVGALQYANNLRLVNRSIADARGLLTGRGAGTVGVLERRQFDVGRESQRLQFELSQRQINFQTALAGFQAPGITGQERAARMKEAKIEASYSQRQLNLGKESYGIEGQLFTETAKRQLDDLKKQRGLLVQQYALEQEQIAVQKRIAVLTARQSQSQAKALSIFSDATGVFDSRLSQSAAYVAQFGGTVRAVNKLMQQTLNSGGAPTQEQRDLAARERQLGEDLNNNGKIGAATGIVGMTRGQTDLTVGEAKGEMVAVLANPRKADLGAYMGAGSNWGGGGGGGVINVTISGNSFGAEMDPEALARRITDEVEDRLGWRAKLVNRNPGTLGG